MYFDKAFLTLSVLDFIFKQSQAMLFTIFKKANTTRSRNCKAQMSLQSNYKKKTNFLFICQITFHCWLLWLNCIRSGSEGCLIKIYIFTEKQENGTTTILEHDLNWSVFTFLLCMHKHQILKNILFHILLIEYKRSLSTGTDLALGAGV